MHYPAIPLIVHDPYFSIWSFDDELNGGYHHHWTGSYSSLAGMIRIDGKVKRFCGGFSQEKIQQQNVMVLPTRTIYTFADDAIRLTVTFLTPILPNELTLMARPLTYIICGIESLDGKAHDCTVYFEDSPEIAINQSNEKVIWGRLKHSSYDLMMMGAANQRKLEQFGDDIRCEWGYCYLGRPISCPGSSAICSAIRMREQFLQDGTLPLEDSTDMPKHFCNGYTSMAVTLPVKAEPGKKAEVWMVAAFDDGESLEYLTARLHGYWRTECSTFSEMLSKSAKEFSDIRLRCEAFDEEMMRDAARIGGGDFASLCAAAYRQAAGAHKMVEGLDGQPWFFSKENFSNGCIATVDVTYPSAPLFLLVQPALLKGMLTPILEYASTKRWKFPFAPHDLGIYPLANGQVYGGGEVNEIDQMPVEECGNMLLLVAALAILHGDWDYVKKYEKLLGVWADYLAKKGFDPENQLCTDDFSGHLAHNANLSLKALLALAGWAKLLEKLGRVDDAARFTAVAKNGAENWMKVADDGDHFRLAFDQPGTWSQKYNLVWNSILELNLFKQEDFRKELDFYLTKNTEFGLPLDNRSTFTKLDWTVWTASLADDDKTFMALLKPVLNWYENTPSRVPMPDWYETTDGRHLYFRARSVVGGVFLPLLKDPELRSKYAAKLQ